MAVEEGGISQQSRGLNRRGRIDINYRHIQHPVLIYRDVAVFLLIPIE